MDIQILRDSTEIECEMCECELLCIRAAPLWELSSAEPKAKRQYGHKYPKISSHPTQRRAHDMQVARILCSYGLSC